MIKHIRNYKKSFTKKTNLLEDSELFENHT